MLLESINLLFCAPVPIIEESILYVFKSMGAIHHFKENFTIEKAIPSLDISKADFFCIILNKKKIKQCIVERWNAAHFLWELLHVLRESFCQFTKKHWKKNVNYRSTKFILDNFLLLPNNKNWVTIKEIKMPKKTEKNTEITKKELVALLSDEENIENFIVDFDTKKKSVETIDTLSKEIRIAWKNYIVRLGQLSDAKDKKTQMHIQKIKNRLESPWEISIQREWLIGFLKITSYQFGGKNVHK